MRRTALKTALGVVTVMCIVGTASAQTFPQGRAGGQDPQGGPVAGTIDSISDNSMVVTTRDGSTVTVDVTDAKVRSIEVGSSSDLASDQMVTVVGQKNSDGTVTATTVEIEPADAPGEGQRPIDGQGQPPMGGQGQPPMGDQGQRPMGGQGQPPTDGQGQPQGAGSRPIVMGTVVSLDGNTLTIKDMQGNSIQVDISSAEIRKTVDSSVSSLAAGQSVMAMGQKNSDGTVTAINVVIRPS
ncbi:MAG TPA: DUF5666 domain-containing protein [Chloroflexota bacterium]|nr:DUF5666 domain-containing protein [Chloroflexota bacterium]